MSNVTQLKPSGYKFVARGSDAVELYIYGPIGADFGGVSANQVKDDLKKVGKSSDIVVRINSEGGDVFEGKAIHTLLSERKGNVTVKVDGLAASAASYIAMAGDSIEMADGAFLMVHDAYGVSFGRAEDMRAYANLLDTVNASLVDIYARRTKQSADKVRKWMKDETWFTASDAVSNGFADKTNETLKVAASVQNPDRFKNLPSSLLPRRAAAAAKLAALVRR